MRRITKNELTNLGWRVTPIRTAIINVLSASSKPLAAKEVTVRLKEWGGGDRATVYRDLDLLLEHGIIRSVEFGDDKARYELTAKGHHHHLICNRCKKVEDIVLPKELGNATTKILKEKRFKVVNHSLEFYGVCSTCQNK